MVCCDIVYILPKKFSENFTLIYLGIFVIAVTAVVLVFNLIYLAIAMTLSIRLFDKLYILMFLEISILMFLVLEVLAIKLVVGAIETVTVKLVNVAVVVILVAMCTYCLLVN